MKMTQRTWMTLVFTIITLFFLQESSGLSSVASFIPRSVLSLTLIFLFIQLLLDIKAAVGLPAPGTASTSAQADSSLRTSQQTPSWLVILWIACLPATVWLFGLVAGASVYCLIFMKWYGSESWKTSLLFAIALGFTLQLVFAAIFKITLYEGVVARMLT